MTQSSRWFWKHTRQGQFHWPWSWSRSRPYFGILLPISSTRLVPHRPYAKSSLVEAGRAANRVQALMHCFTLKASNFKGLNNFCLYSPFILSWPHTHLDGDELNQWNENKLTPRNKLTYWGPQQQLYYWVQKRKQASGYKQPKGHWQSLPMWPGPLCIKAASRPQLAGLWLVVSVSMQPEILPHGWTINSEVKLFGFKLLFSP